MVLEQIKVSFIFALFFFGFIIGYFLKRFLDEDKIKEDDKDKIDKNDDDLTIENSSSSD